MRVYILSSVETALKTVLLTFNRSPLKPSLLNHWRSLSVWDIVILYHTPTLFKGFHDCAVLILVEVLLRHKFSYRFELSWKRLGQSLKKHLLTHRQIFLTA